MDILAGNQLRRESSGLISAQDALQDVDVVAVYFASRWCYTCRLFTSYLAETYRELKRNKDSFELVFVSSDHTESEEQAFKDESHADWLCVPFTNPIVVESLYSHHNVSILPTLVLLNKDGSVITTQGTLDLIEVGACSYSSWKEGKACCSPEDDHLEHCETFFKGCCSVPWGSAIPDRKTFLSSSFVPTCRAPVHLLAGKTLERKSGVSLTKEEALKDAEVIVLCFWAHWCSICQDALSQLSLCYQALKTQKSPVEFVFIKSDYCAGPKDSFMNEEFADWLIVPLSEDESTDKSLIRRLFDQFGILRVPLVLVMRQDGELITAEGLRDITVKGAAAFDEWRLGRTGTSVNNSANYEEDKLHDGCCYLPWAASMYRRSSFNRRIAVCPPCIVHLPPPPSRWVPQEPAELLAGKRLVRNTSKGLEETTLDEISKTEVVVFYFAAHWCPPCRKFTPILADVYRKVKEKVVPIEVVFISWDENEVVMTGHMQESHAGWLAVAYDDLKNENFNARFNVDTIPHLYVLGKSGQMITTHGQRDVALRGAEAVTSWLKGEAATTDNDAFDESSSDWAEGAVGGKIDVQ